MSNRLVQILVRRALILAGLCLILAPRSVGAQTNANPPAPRRPSIIFILADDLGYGDLGCYGQTKIKTPNIDKLAAEGMRFTSFYAGSPVCAPSRAALLTGLDTGHSRIRSNSTIPLGTNDLTVAEILERANYSTAAIGKWGLGEKGSSGVPGLQGFGEWLGYLNQVEAHNYYPTVLDRFSQGKQYDVQITTNLDNQKGEYSDDFFTAAALNFIRLKKPVWYDHFRPFFLYLAYTIPHADNELGGMTGNGMEVPEDAPYSSETWPAPEKNKAAMITRLDRYVGSIMDELKNLKIDDNTIVIFSSDNGAHMEGGVNPKFFDSSGPLRGIKRDLYEGGIRVPFIVRWPERIKPGTTNDLPLAFWDFLPTAAELSGQPVPKNIQGISFMPALVGDAQTNRHEFLYWEFHEDGFKQAVRMGDWKAVRFGVDGPLELYNLKSDLGEKQNVARQNPAIVAKIKKFLKTARTEDKNWPVKTAAETSKKEYGLEKLK